MNSKGDKLKNYLFDCQNPNNFLLGENTIHIVDELEEDSRGQGNTLKGLLQAFVLNYQPENSAYFDKALIEPKRLITKKCLLAAESVKLRMPTIQISRIEESLRLAGLKDKWEPIEEKINKLRVKIPDNHEERTWELEKYFDRL